MKLTYCFEDFLQIEQLNSMNKRVQNLEHVPVLAEGVVKHLITDRNGLYIDGTYGRGGHARAMLNVLSSKAQFVALDRDQTAIDAGSKHLAIEERLVLKKSEFASVAEFAQPGSVSGLLLDLGPSTPQLTDVKRGFSFNRPGPLDMRMDQKQNQSLFEKLRNTNAKQLAKILWDYAQVKHAEVCANAILNSLDKLNNTVDLASVIATSLRINNPRINPATTVFLALRMWVNDELQQLEQALTSAVSLLKAGGRVAVISFHSTELRAVRKFFKAPSIFTPFSLHDENQSKFKKIVKLTPSSEECNTNPNSRSATLSVYEKIGG